MKRNIVHSILFSVVLFGAQFVVAQGSLTPPGAPGPTMKTLQQIEPRTPISSLPLTITNSGSYYLTTNLTVNSGNAIVIATNGVTLDLNGFTIESTAPSATGTAILLNSGLRNIAIRNGFIQSGVTFSGGIYSGSGFNSGIDYSGTAPQNASISHMSVRGVLNHGLSVGVGLSTIAESCTAHTGGGYGIVASVVRDCAAIEWGITAIFGRQVSNCRAIATGGFDGISAITAENCYAESNTGNGISTETANNCSSSSIGGRGLNALVASNCRGISTSSYGIFADQALHCRGTSLSGNGLSATVAAFCYGDSLGSLAFSAFIANSCYVAGNSSIIHKYNMP